MSQRNVELVVGRLVTDEQFRHRFGAERDALIAELAAAGIELTPCEIAALSAFDPRAAERCARRLDPRLQKADLHGPGFWKRLHARRRMSNSDAAVRRQGEGEGEGTARSESGGSNGDHGRS